jgi:hypothetical protein
LRVDWIPKQVFGAVGACALAQCIIYTREADELRRAQATVDAARAQGEDLRAGRRALVEVPAYRTARRLIKWPRRLGVLL